jgi:hypothetical protein
MPVKLPDDLVRVARAEAEATSRSLTAQVEHWARLGRAVESALLHEDALALKRTGGDVRSAFAGERKREAVLALLDAIAGSPERSGVAARVRRSAKAVYGTDPEFPGMIVRIEPDGTHTPGRLENRRFVPAV